MPFATSKSMVLRTFPSASLISTFQAPGQTDFRLQVRQGEPLMFKGMSLIYLASTE